MATIIAHATRLPQARPRSLFPQILSGPGDGRVIFGGLLLLAAWLCTTGMTLGQSALESSAAPGRDLTELSLEELANLEVTSVSKKPEKLSQAAAAITVITQDDLRHSGVTSIAEALRLAPGLEVGQVDAHTWAISSRGFNDTFANKLLVLLDGRSVYTPLFSGVYWDVQDTLLEDIDRIEIIRGPGATLWGANAVNGVVNIITKSAKETQGGLVVAGGGTEELGFAGLRYGGKLSETAFYRVYTKYFTRDSSVQPNGDLADDRWQMGRSGFRVDWDASSRSTLTLQGDIYGGKLNQTYTFPTLAPPDFSEVVSKPVNLSGGNLLGRWRQEFSADADMTLQLYYDRTRRAAGYFREERDTYDVDWQQHLAVGERQDWVGGAGYRLSADDLRGSFVTSFDPSHRATQLLNLFAQDDIELIKERVHLILGSKFEHNDYTGFEIQPAARLLWSPDQRNRFWGSVARAVRTPSRAESDIRLNNEVQPGTPPTVYSVFGSEDFRSEDLLAFEAGYRVQAHDRLSLDLAAFYNIYNDLRTSEFQGIAPDPSLPGSPQVARLRLENKATAETYGTELTANWHVTESWRWRATYTFLQLQLHRKASSNDTSAEDDEGTSPHHQFSLQSSLDLPWHLQFDVTTRYVDRLSDLGVNGYVSLDLRLGWKPSRNVELSIVGQNLLDDRHPEFTPTIIPTQRTEVPRGVYGKILWRF